MHAERAVAPPSRGVPLIVARVGADVRVHHRATLGTMSDRRVAAPVIRVLAGVRLSRSGDHLGVSEQRIKFSLAPRPREFFVDTHRRTDTTLAENMAGSFAARLSPPQFA